MIATISRRDFRGTTPERQSFTKTRLLSCIGEGVSFRGSRFTDTQILAEKGDKVSFRGAAFDDCRFVNAALGPRTLDLSATTWRGAELKEVRFDFAMLEDADFTGARLSDVYFRSGKLSRVRFVGAELRKVSFEGARLDGADFTGASFFKMDRWGEPDWSGATISDELRYQFGELKDAARKVEALIASPATNAEERGALERLREAHGSLLAAPECSLIGRELEDIIRPHLFPRILKALKALP